MHLADAFIQSDLQCIQAIHFFVSMCVPLGIEPTTFALLTQRSNHLATRTPHLLSVNTVLVGRVSFLQHEITIRHT